MYEGKIGSQLCHEIKINVPVSLNEKRIFSEPYQVEGPVPQVYQEAGNGLEFCPGESDLTHIAFFPSSLIQELDLLIVI